MTRNSTSDPSKGTGASRCADDTTAGHSPTRKEQIAMPVQSRSVPLHPFRPCHYRPQRDRPPFSPAAMLGAETQPVRRRRWRVSALWTKSYGARKISTWRTRRSWSSAFSETVGHCLVSSSMRRALRLPLPRSTRTAAPTPWRTASTRVSDMGRRQVPPGAQGRVRRGRRH